MSDDVKRDSLMLMAGVSGLLAAAAATLLGPAYPLYDAPLPMRRPRYQAPRISWVEQKRRERASKMERLAMTPQPLKHMHAAARRRATETPNAD